MALFFVLLASLLAPGVALAQAPPNAKALESRLYAPCCFGGTLDIHESDLARELRHEIEGRIERGESMEVIQVDFVDRYGEKVLAARSDRPARTMATVLVVFTVVAGAALAMALRRWTRGAAAKARDVPVRARAARRDVDAPAGPDVPDVLDARIDAELAALDA